MKLSNVTSICVRSSGVLEIGVFPIDSIEAPLQTYSIIVGNNLRGYQDTKLMSMSNELSNIEVNYFNKI